MIDPATKNLIKSMFGNCEIALRCTSCKEVYTTKPVVEILELDATKAQTLGMSVLPTVSAHKCQKKSGLPWG